MGLLTSCLDNNDRHESQKSRTTDITAKVSSLVPGTGDSIETDE